MGLISFLVSSHYNLFPLGFFVFPGFNIIECLSPGEEKTNNYLEWLNHESYCILPSRTNLHTFYDPIGILMDEFLESLFYPWHDFISYYPDLYLNFKLQVRMVSIFIYITLKPSPACWVIYCKGSSIDSFNKVVTLDL